MNQQQPTFAEVAHTDAALERLLEHFLNRASVPGNDEKSLSVDLLHRLSRAVLAEGYGE